MTIFEKNVKMELETLGLVGLFLGTFLAATILPFSSEALLLFFLSKGIQPSVCLGVAIIGNSLGGVTNYALGRLGNPLWLTYLGVKIETIIKRENWVVKYGSWLAFFSWIPLIGDPLLVALGYFRSRLIPTFSWMVIGKSLRYLLIYLIYYYW